MKKQTGKVGSQVKLLTVYPKKTLEDETKTLKEYGLGKQEALIVEIK